MAPSPLCLYSSATLTLSGNHQRRILMFYSYFMLVSRVLCCQSSLRAMGQKGR